MFDINANRDDVQYVSYWPNGQMWEKGTFRNKVKVGLWTTWYANGQKNSEGHAVEGKPDGVWRMWHPTGFLNWKATFYQGELGECTTYNGPEGFASSQEIDRWRSFF